MPGGRPKSTITDMQMRQVQMLAALGLSHEDIATVVELDRRTMERRCKRQLDRGRAEMRARLHRIQWDLAKKSAAMAIWLGKQYLGQRDVPVPTSSQGAVVEYVQRIITTTSQPSSSMTEPQSCSDRQKENVT